MMGKTHKLTGTAVGLATAPIFVHNFWEGTVWVTLTTFSALLPDIDHHGSTVTKSLGPITRSISWVLRQVSPHRGLTHSALGIGSLLVLLAAIAPVWCAVAVAIGCMTHVLGDMITTAKVRFWWPFSKRKVGFALLKTGGWTERYAVVPITFVLCIAWSLKIIWPGSLRWIS